MSQPPFERRSFLLGALGGVVTGAGAGVAAARLAVPPGRHIPPGTEFADRRSYSQSAEDLVIRDLFGHLRISRPTYLDIGAHDPIYANNTYLFYEAGSRGVLVEPNPALTGRLRSVRPGDTVLDIGIGAQGEDQEADYYVMKGSGELNTFSADDVKELKEKLGSDIVREVIKRKLVNINKVLAEQFPRGAPDLLSTDTEGYDFTILSTLDFERFRPRVLCVETLAGVEVEPRIIELLRGKDYQVRGGSFLNTIFADRRYLRSI